MILRAPPFWDAEPDHPAARLLAPLGQVYGALTARRMARPGATAPCPVICVGNLTLGGAGKTPAALAVAALLRGLGARPAFLSRGYGGRRRGPVVVDPDRHGADEVGDEPLLLARAATTVVARDRPAGAALCVAEGGDVIVMDDGLQNPSLIKNLALAVVDGSVGLGNGLPFPAGPLRAPADRQWPYVGAVILVGEGRGGERVAAEAAALGLPCHHARLVLADPGIAGKRVLAFAGIGRPGKFFASLRAAGAEIVAARPFPDHHAYPPGVVAALGAQAVSLGAELVTTEKDAVRIPAGEKALARPLPVGLVLGDPEPLRAHLRRAYEA